MRIWHSVSIGLAMMPFGPPAVSAVFSTGPIPQYTSNVTENQAVDKQSATISTKDQPPQVEGWFKANLPKGTTEKTTGDGAHIFYLPGGATVDVERNGSGSEIAMTWEAR